MFRAGGQHGFALVIVCRCGENRQPRLTSRVRLWSRAITGRKVRWPGGSGFRRRGDLRLGCTAGRAKQKTDGLAGNIVRSDMGGFGDTVLR